MPVTKNYEYKEDGSYQLEVVTPILNRQESPRGFKKKVVLTSNGADMQKNILMTRKHIR